MAQVNILQSIKVKMPELPPSQRHVADHILKMPFESAFFTLEQLSREVGTSTTTVMRLAFSLGYQGYSSFQKELQEFIRNRFNPNDRLDMKQDIIEQASLLDDCVKMQTDNIKRTSEYLNSEIINQCVDLICGARNIYTIGSRTSMAPAYYLYQSLNLLFGNTQYLNPHDGDVVEKILPVGEGDVVIAFSFPRYVIRACEITTMLVEQNAQAIVVTDGYHAPLALLKNALVLPCAFNSLSFHNSIVGAIFLSDFLVTSVTARNLERVKKLLQDSEAKFSRLNIHMSENLPPQP